MVKFISFFNNKGGVGKTSITWNVADTLGEMGKRVLLIDFDPQCNLSIAMLSSDKFKKLVSTENSSKTIRSFLQGYLQNTGAGEAHTYTGEYTSKNVEIVAGDFWLNVYSDSLSVGNDLLTGNGIAKFTAIRTLHKKLAEEGKHFDYVMIDLPPSFGGLVRSALYSSDYLIIPCTSDTFSEYCIGLISQMLPQFISDWEIGVQRFKQNNYGSKEYDNFGKPVFGGWIFNGFDTRDAKMLRADEAHYKNIEEANNALAENLSNSIKSFTAVRDTGGESFYLGGIEDMNVLMQNSLWQSIPASKLGSHQQVKDLTGGKAGWSVAQINTLNKVKDEVEKVAAEIVSKF